MWLLRKDYWRSDDQALVGDSALDISFDLAGPTIALTDSYDKKEVNDRTTMSAPPGTP